MPKRKTNKRYTAERKKRVAEAVIQDRLSYREAAKLYEVQEHDGIQQWERICLEEEPEGLALERRGGQAEETAKQDGRGFAG